MPTDQCQPVILCGGTGTRLWPLSRQAQPKPFHQLNGKHSLFQQALLRSQVVSDLPPMIVTHTDYRFLVMEQAAAIGVDLGDLLCEPAARNTAPAIAMAAWAQAASDRTQPLWVMPADHAIPDPNILLPIARHENLQSCATHLCALGIEAASPSPAYGYIQSSQQRPDGLYHVSKFHEKPSVAEAEALLVNDDCCWNSGMFLFSAPLLLAELKQHRPDIFVATEIAWSTRQQHHGALMFDAKAYEKCPSESIDYAVMEHTKRLLMLRLQGQWSDVGSWYAIHDLMPTDESNNVAIGDVHLSDAVGNLVYTSKPLVAVTGVRDHVIVATDDAVLVMPRQQDACPKALLESLQSQDRAQLRTHSQVNRPWGHYTCITNGPGFQVKRIHVNPGAKLSLQRHQHRSEHWVVVSGDAQVLVGDHEYTLSAGQSVDIPVRAMHRLINHTNKLVEIIEVQRGDYLGEDDIERFDDCYGRSQQHEEKV